MNKRNTARIIFEARVLQEKTVEDMVLVLHISEGLYLNYEEGKRRIPKTILKEIVAFLELDPSTFLLDTPVSHPKGRNIVDIFRFPDASFKISLLSLFFRPVQFAKQYSESSNEAQLKHVLFEPTKVETHKPRLFWQTFLFFIFVAILGFSIEDIVLTNFALSFSVPFSLLVFMLEIHIPKNMKGTTLFLVFLIGGVASIFLVYALRFVIGYPEILFVSDLITGTIEEVLKIIVVVLALKLFAIKDVLTGILIGFAVGCGFDVFETSSYGMGSFLEVSFFEMILSLGFRSLYAVLGIGHHFWTGMLAGVFVMVNPSTQVKWRYFFSPLFLQMLVLVILIHALWNFTSVNLWVVDWLVLAISLFLFSRFYMVQYVKHIRKNLPATPEMILESPQESIVETLVV